MAQLKTDYKDDIFIGARKYQMINNADGTVSLVDVTTYTQQGDYLGANDMNAITGEVNGKAPSDHDHIVADITDFPASMPANGGTAQTISDTLPVAKGGTGATTAATALTNLGLTATAAELNYMDGVTSAVQTQINGKAASSHTHAASNITNGTFGGPVVANASAVATLTTAQVRNIKSSTTDLTAGSSALTTGDLYIVYE
ncbi:MAG: hypothetical protein K0R92_1509 [Lachnospiraceae bacterium]|nr:hypothetical protein [Lachnospiraceae bacterium]